MTSPAAEPAPAPRPRVRLANAHPAPTPAPRPPGAAPVREQPREDAVWVTTRWSDGGLEHVEETPAVADRRVGELVHCRWYDPRLQPADGAWLHLDDVAPRDTSGTAHP